MVASVVVGVSDEHDALDAVTVAEDVRSDAVEFFSPPTVGLYAVGVEDEIVGHARLVVREVDAQRQHQRDRQFVGQRDECIAAPKANATGIVETAAALCDQFEFAFGRDGKFECASRVALGLRNSSAAFEVADADIGANSGQSVSSADAARRRAVGV